MTPRMPSNTAVLDNYLKLLAPYLDDKNITEVCINKPGEVVTEDWEGWHYYNVPEVTFDYCEHLAKLIATSTKQDISQTHPILSATLPSGVRVQVCMSPTTRSGTVSFTFRKPSDSTFPLEDYEANGYFKRCAWINARAIDSVPEVHREYFTDFQFELCEHLKQKRITEFFRLAVEKRQNIILSGATGSGKTTFMKSLVTLISHDQERLLSVENVDELRLYKTHKNSVSLFYSAGEQGKSKTGQKELIESSLRQRPDRVLNAEITRGDEAFYYLRNVGSGHPGSMTSMHANSAWEARLQLIMMLKESKAGTSLAKEDIMMLLNLNVDIIGQVNRIDGKRYLTEIDYNPYRKIKYRIDAEVA